MGDARPKSVARRVVAAGRRAGTAQARVSFDSSVEKPCAPRRPRLRPVDFWMLLLD
jgi:hypothetical protein